MCQPATGSFSVLAGQRRKAISWGRPIVRNWDSSNTGGPAYRGRQPPIVSPLNARPRHSCLSISPCLSIGTQSTVPV